MDMNRREALGSFGAAAAGFAAGGLAQNAQGQMHDHADHGMRRGHPSDKSAGGMFPGYDAAKGEYAQEPLPYAFDALEPYIDAETMRLHYTKHAAGYVKGINKAAGKLKEARSTGDYSLVEYWSNELTFNGGGHTLHTIFWPNMAPAGQGGGGEPSGKLRELIDKSFGSFKAMKDQFTAAASSVQGSGWGIMAQDLMSGHLLIYQAKNQQKLTTWASMPVLVCDVWEHAYYLKYQNRRGDYINAWWNVVNWKDVEKRVHHA